MIDHRSIGDGMNASTGSSDAASREAVHSSQVALLHMALLRPSDVDSCRLTSRHLAYRYAMTASHLRRYRTMFEASAAEIVTHTCSDEQKVAELGLAAERALFAVGVERELL